MARDKAAPNEENSNSQLNRRSYLKFASSVTASFTSLGLVGTSAARGEFDTVVDMAEAGADPTGHEPIDPVFQREADDDTLLVFPEGTYKLDRARISGLKNVNVVAAKDAEPTFVADASRNDELIQLEDVDGFQMKGIEVRQNSVSSPSANETVNLGDEGLSSGDAIDTYLQNHLESNVEVIIPDGEYQISEGGVQAITGTYSGTTVLRAPNEAVLRHPDNMRRKIVTNCSDGVLRFQNLTFRGQVKADSSGNPDHSRWQFRADANAKVVFDSIDLSDGQYQDVGHANGFIAEQYHAGEAVLRNCHVEGYGDNGAYLSIPSRGGDGAVKVIGGLYKNNNVACVRIGSSNSLVRDVTIVQDAPSPEASTGLNQRGLRLNGPGDNITVENTHITVTEDVPSSHGCIQFHRKISNGQGSLKNVALHRDGGQLIDNQQNTASNYSGDTIYASGTGTLNVPSHFTSVCEGSDCLQPRLEPIGDGTGSSTSPALPNEIVIDGGTLPNRASKYDIQVSGDVEKSPDLGTVNSFDSVAEGEISGRVIGGKDGYRFSGKITHFGLDGSASISMKNDG